MNPNFQIRNPLLCHLSYLGIYDFVQISFQVMISHIFIIFSKKNFFESLILSYTHVSICLHQKYWYGNCKGSYLIRICQNILPKLALLEIQNFFHFFLLNRNVIFAEKLQNGLYFETSTAKMWNPNKKYYTYPERSWNELFKTAKKFQNFSHLSFRTYWMKKSQKNQSGRLVA